MDMERVRKIAEGRLEFSRNERYDLNILEKAKGDGMKRPSEIWAASSWLAGCLPSACPCAAFSYREYMYNPYLLRGSIAPDYVFIHSLQTCATILWPTWLFL